MFSNRLTFAALAVACITAAGAGGYFASRQNTVPVPVAAEQPLAVSDAPLVDTPVQETETVVDDRDNRVSRATAKPGLAAAATVPPRPVRPTPAPAPEIDTHSRSSGSARARPLVADEHGFPAAGDVTSRRSHGTGIAGVFTGGGRHRDGKAD